RQVEERYEKSERLKHGEDAVRQPDVACADRGDQKRQDACGFVAIELLEQTARDDHTCLRSGGTDSGRIDFRRVDKQQIWRRQSGGNRHLLDDVRQLAFFLVAQIRWSGMQTDD